MNHDNRYGMLPFSSLVLLMLLWKGSNSLFMNNTATEQLVKAGLSDQLLLLSLFTSLCLAVSLLYRCFHRILLTARRVRNRLTDMFRAFKNRHTGNMPVNKG